METKYTLPELVEAWNRSQDPAYGDEMARRLMEVTNNDDNVTKEDSSNKKDDWRYLTIVYRYKDERKMRVWYDLEVGNRLCCRKGNEELPMQVTGLAMEDSLRKLEELEQNYKG